MDKKTRCCAANLTIGPKAPKQSPLNSCLYLKGTINDGSIAESMIPHRAKYQHKSVKVRKFIEVPFLGTKTYVLRRNSALYFSRSMMKYEIM
jgi:hypothetical protein